MSLFKRMFSGTVAGAQRQTAGGSSHPDYSDLISRIISGDPVAEAELVDRFRAGVFQIILGIVRNPPLAEDLSQDAWITIIKKIRSGDVRQPESLNFFVSSVARFHAIDQIRRIRRRGQSGNLEEAEQLRDPTPNRLDDLERSERSHEIREVIDELIPRYRELLLRFYINEEPKDVICAELGLTSAQFDGVIHRARNRYRELYLKGKSAEEMRRRG